MHCVRFINNPQYAFEISEFKLCGRMKKVYEHTQSVQSNLKLASAVSLTLQVRHSSSNTAADWSGAVGPSPGMTADRVAEVS